MKRIRRNRKRYSHQRGVTLHARIVALEGEENTIGHTKRTEYAPTVHKTNLTRRENGIPRIPDVAIMK
jgi:hypothetical protein